MLRARVPPEPVELTIERLGQRGEGVARWEGQSVFVPGAFPGERVQVQLERAGKVVRGRLLGVSVPSPHRRPSPCGYSAACGGCDWLELSGGAQREAKQEAVLAALEQVGGIRRETLTVRPLLAAPREMGYRRRAVLHFARGGALGYFGRRSHERVAVDACAALSAPLAELPGRLSPLLAPLARDAEEVHLLAEGEGVAFAVKLSGPVAARHVEACEAAVRRLGLAGAVVVPREGSPRLVGRPVLRAISPLRPEVPLYLRPDAFSQAHAEANVGLVTAALVELAPRDTDAVLELYAGNGNFTFPLAGAAASVLAVESAPVSVALAQRSVREGRVDNVRLVQGEAAAVCEGLMREGRCFERLLADPPRTGAPGLAGWARGLGVRQVVYVACDAVALARDGAALVAAGYRPLALQVVDMFPQTHHVEAVLSFAREEQPRSPRA